MPKHSDRFKWRDVRTGIRGRGMNTLETGSEEEKQ